MLDFASFCVDSHFSSCCTRRRCEYKRLDENIKEYMLRTDKTDDEKKIFFIFVMNNIGVFYKYYNLALKNIYLTNLRLYKKWFYILFKMQLLAPMAVSKMLENL